MEKNRVTINELRSLVNELIKEDNNIKRLPSGVIIDTRKTRQTKEEILSMYANEGYTSISGKSLLSDFFRKYDRDIDVYILVGELLNSAKYGDYLPENCVATQNYVPEIPNLKIITNLD